MVCKASTAVLISPCLNLKESTSMSTRPARPVQPSEPVSSGDFLDAVLLWLGENWWWIVGLLLLLVLSIFILRKVKQKYGEIQKLWIFTLFFLTKRQMMIPLVIALSTKDKILDKTTQNKLMEIRERCREVSFKKSPVARLELETEVSEILYNYFSKIEKNGQLKTNSKFYKIVKDLEFIDAKLVQLQKVYNLEATRWNRQLRLPGIKLLLHPLGIRSFEPFN